MKIKILVKEQGSLRYLGNNISLKLSIKHLIIPIVMCYLISCQMVDFKKVASIKTQDVTQLTSISALANGTLVDIGQGISDHGFCWNLTGAPSVNDFKIANGPKSSEGSFSNTISNLKPGTKYYLMAWAISESTVIYGSATEFKTIAVVPILTTSILSSITSSTAVGGGNISSDGGAVVTARGVCWGLASNPTVVNSKTTDGSGIGSFSSTVSGLSPGQTYYLRAYGTNSAGTAYGNQLVFNTTVVLPTIITTSVSATSYTTTTIGGNITSDGGAAVTSRGVCWSISQNPTTANGKTSDGTGTGSFISSITSLSPGITYYFRTYATNSVGTVYGNQVSATTISLSIPTISTTSATSITASSATSGGNITSDGGTAVTTRGVCWSTTQNPTIGNSRTIDGTGTGIFTSYLTGLSPGTTYYVRAYSVNSAGTSYGNQLSFTSTLTIPSVNTLSISSYSYTTCSIGGNVTSDGGATVSSRGVCWSTTQNPTIGNSRTIDGTGTGSFNSSVSSLSPGTTYYLRAYAINSLGVAYGSQVSVTTLSLNPPIVSTTSVTSITSSSAVSGGSITSGGGALVTARGVCWSTSQNPTTANSKTADGTGTGIFNSSVTGLSPGTTYYVRAYAVNNLIVAYGSQISFKTLSLSIPIVATSSITSITSNSAIAGGNISSDGGLLVTVRGICWSTSQNPTTSNSKTSNGTGTGSFSSTITGLTSGMTYYVRAYATNSLGTSYANQQSFTTLTNPSITTTAISSVGFSSGISGGNVTSDGGSTVTARGVCWSTSQNPTTSNSKTSNGTGTGSFSSTITGLTSGMTYYVRAYATNSAGTTYGNGIVFTTATYAGDYAVNGYRIRPGNATEFISAGTIETFKTISNTIIQKNGFGNYFSYDIKIEISTNIVMVGGTICYKVIATPIDPSTGLSVGGMWDVWTGDATQKPADLTINYYNPVKKQFILNCYYVSSAGNRIMYEVCTKL